MEITREVKKTTVASLVQPRGLLPSNRRGLPFSPAEVPRRTASMGCVQGRFHIPGSSERLNAASSECAHLTGLIGVPDCDDNA